MDAVAAEAYARAVKREMEAGTEHRSVLCALVDIIDESRKAGGPTGRLQRDLRDARKVNEVLQEELRRVRDELDEAREANEMLRAQLARDAGQVKRRILDESGTIRRKFPVDAAGDVADRLGIDTPTEDQFRAMLRLVDSWVEPS